jgi:regulator of protease activity HflC (stomatin/prohibitin superfamily)
MQKEKTINAMSGYIAVILEIIVLALAILSIISKNPLLIILSFTLFIFVSVGFTVINPNEAVALVLFGEYRGTIRRNGFFWVIPFYVRKKVSLRARNFNSETIKVNDKIGNPIMIGLVLVWRVEDTYKALFSVDEFEHFVVVQSEAALRKLAGLYPYDNFEDHDAVITLRAGGEEVNQELEKEIVERLSIAGIDVIEARINYIAYSSEIASAMLRRQQATAIVSARFKIVEGAVSMVEMALDQLSSKEIVHLDEEKKASMVSNLMVVLCGDKDATPVVNTGTLY